MLDTESDLIAALVAKWKSEASLSGIAGPYYGATPEGTELPRCVLSCLPATLNTTTGSSRIYDVTAQFRLWDSQPEQTVVHATAVGEVFRPESLTLSGLTDSRLIRHRLIRSSLEKPDVNMAVSIVEFGFMLQQARG